MKYAYLTLCFALAGCGLNPSSFSTSRVQEFSSIETMNQFASCKKISNIDIRYSVLLLSPGDREAAAHAKLKDAAEALGANTVVMVSHTSIFGEIKDTAQGIA